PAFLITTDITITGLTGDDGITIAQNADGGMRLFAVQPGGNLTLVYLTLTGGSAQDNGDALGGAIFNQGTVAITSSTLTQNVAQGGVGGMGFGGAIYNDQDATLFIVNSTLSANAAFAGLGGTGAARFRGSGGLGRGLRHGRSLGGLFLVGSGFGSGGFGSGRLGAGTFLGGHAFPRMVWGGWPRPVQQPGAGRKGRGDTQAMHERNRSTPQDLDKAGRCRLKRASWRERGWMADLAGSGWPGYGTRVAGGRGPQDLLSLLPHQ
ncbi:MAG: hypothetical protein ACK42S_15075, partial [Caldimonas sp.]